MTGAEETLAQLRPRPLRRNVIASGARWGVTLVVMAVVFPVMIDRLGAEGFGLWAVLTTPTSMMGLLSFGLAPAAVALMGNAIGGARAATSADAASDELQSAGSLGVGVLLLSSVAAVLTLGVGWTLTVPIVSFLDVEKTQEGDARLLFRSAVVCVAAMLVGGALTSQVEAIGRVDLSAFSLGAVTVINAGLLLVAVLVFSSLRSLATVQLITAGTNLVLPAVVYRVSGAIALWRWRRLERRSLGTLFRLSLGLGGAGALNAAIDPLIKLTVGGFLGTAPVAAYELASRVVNAAAGVFMALLYPLMPHLATLAGRGETDAVSVTVTEATRRGASIALPSFVALAVAADPLLSVWIGDDTPTGTASSMVILTVSASLMLMVTPSYHALQGSGQGRRVLSIQLVSFLVVGAVAGLIALGILQGDVAGASAFAIGASVGAAVTVWQYQRLAGVKAAMAPIAGCRRGLLAGVLVIPWPLLAGLAGWSASARLAVTACSWGVVGAVTLRRGRLRHSLNGTVGYAEQERCKTPSP